MTTPLLWPSVWRSAMVPRRRLNSGGDGVSRRWTPKWWTTRGAYPERGFTDVFGWRRL